MGLSDEERQIGLYHCLNRLNDWVKDWENPYYDRQTMRKISTARIINLVKKTWHAFLGKQSNGGHWIFGSSSTNSITTETPNSPWEIAITGHLEPIAKDILEPDRFKWPEKEFDVLEFAFIPNLLKENERRVFQIYRETENIIYYLRRYQDKFCFNLKELNKLISDIQGECFQQFTNNSDFAKAYLVYEIIKILYDNYYCEEKQDVITKLLISNTLHHDIMRTGMKLNLPELAKIHIDLINNKQNRVLVILALCDSIYQYNHIKQKIEDGLKSAFPEQMDLIIQEMNRYKDFYSSKKNENKYESNPLNCYGFAGYDLKNQG